jgi:tRNA threonylcarbamoyladenosine biosynthesis protein TsaB
MKILGIDTSTKFLCLGICDDTKIYEYNLESGRQLSSLLGITIKRVLDALGWEVSDIDYLACGLGPGSFTGMRTGISLIKGMGWDSKKPIIGISTLDILALNAGETDKQIIPIVDAKRNLIYTSVYKTKNNRLIKIKPYMLLSEEGLFKIAKNDCLILGDAIDLYKEKIIANINGVTVLDKDYWYPKPRNIIKIALERIKLKKLDNAFDIRPIYLYPKECQIREVK